MDLDYCSASEDKPITLKEMKVLLEANNKTLLLWLGPVLAFLVLVTSITAVVTSITAAKLFFDTGPKVASLGGHAHR